MQLPNQVADEGVEGATADAAAGQEVRSPETEGVTENDQSMSAAILQEEKMRPPPRPLESGEEKLWQIFCDIDEDDGGTLDKEEVAKMSKKLGVTLSPDDLATAFEKMDRQRKGEVDFDCFVQWWHQVMGERRREARKKAAELFYSAQLGGHTFATFNLGLMFLQGCGVEKELTLKSSLRDS